MIGYRAEIGSLQYRQRPLRKIHPNTGILSYHASGVLHFGQCDGGVTSDSPRGSRHTTTFKKLPTHAPSAKINGMNARCGMGQAAYKPRAEAAGDAPGASTTKNGTGTISVSPALTST